jgi:hypothetical protein
MLSAQAHKHTPCLTLPPRSPALQELSKQYQAKDAKCDDLRRKLRDAKAALAARSREVEMAQRMLVKAGEDRAALQVGWVGLCGGREG